MSPTSLQGRRWRVFGRGALGVAAAVGATAIYIGTSHTPGSQSGSTVALTARVWLDPSASAATPTRCSSAVSYAAAVSSGCVTSNWNAAYQAAHQGDTVYVRPGAYTPDNPLINADASKTTNASYVTFQCSSASAENVTFNPVGGGTDPDYQMDDFIIGDHVKIDGGGNWRTSTPSCMRFHSIWTSQLGGSPVFGNDLVFTGIHMQTMEALHSNGVTVTNSEFGPSVGCKNQQNATVSFRCLNRSDDGEDWYYANNLQNCGTETNSNLGFSASNVTFTSDWFHGAQIRDAGDCHNGAIETQGDLTGFTLTRSRFEQNVVYDLLLGSDPSGTVSSVVIENNWLGTPVDSFQNVPTCTITTCPEIAGFFSLELDDRGGYNNFTNWLVRFNTMSGNVRYTIPQSGLTVTNGSTAISSVDAAFNTGWSSQSIVIAGVTYTIASVTNTTHATLSTTYAGSTTANASYVTPNNYSSFRWIGNLQASSDCSAVAGFTGVTYDFNAIVGATCGTNSTNMASLGVIASTGYPINFNPSGSPSIPTVAQSTGADYTIAADHNGTARTATTSLGAVGP